MSEPRNRILNPMLALISLYKKDGKDFEEVINDIMKRLNTFGLGLEEAYVKDKILPWVFSFLFMTISEQILQEYIQSLGGTATGHKPTGGPQGPVPKNTK